MAPMSDPTGWQPTTASRSGADAFRVSPFARLARAHVLAAAGDALVTMALANSLFFQLDPNEARWKVFLYLALTMAPLALVSPFIGPALDRSVGGRRWMIVGVNAVRAIACLIMIDDLSGLLLFPEAFTVLAMGKAYGVARAAVVPTVVHTDSELVEANAKLQLLSGLAVPVAAVPAGIAFLIAGSEGLLVVAVIAYAAATLASVRIPATQVADAPATAAEAAELRGIGVLLAASAMGLIRGIVGFLTFLLLFELRDEDAWQMVVVIVCSGTGALIGALIAPVLRRSYAEEKMLMAMLGLAGTSAGLSAWAGGLASAAVLAGAIAVASASGRLAFDSLVQRDAPDANRGRSFARFELRFQTVWVVGAVIPVLVTIPLRIGFLVVAGVAAFALFSYVAGQRAAQRAHVDRPPAGPGIPPDTEAPAEAATREVGAPADTTAVQPYPPPVDPTLLE